MLNAFVAIRSPAADQQGSPKKEISILALQVGMVFVEDVRRKSGALLVTRGTEVTPGLLERLCNLRDAEDLPPVKVIMAADLVQDG